MKTAMKLLLLAAILLAVSAPALAAAGEPDSFVAAFTEAEGEEPGEEAPPTTLVSEGGIEPAELAPPVEAAEQEDQWTAKFLAPTVAILAALGIVAAIALYGIRLRGRYRVVE